MQGTRLNAKMPRPLDRDAAGVSEISRAKGTIPMTGYCMRCRESREIQNGQPVRMKNGRTATRGNCGECGATIFRIGKAS